MYLPLCVTCILLKEKEKAIHLSFGNSKNAS